MLNFLKDYFSFSKNERNGIIILLSAIFVLIIAPMLLPLFKKDETIRFTQFKKEIEEYEKQNENVNAPAEEAPFLSDLFENYELFEFNPNNLSEEKWKLLGIKSRTIEIIKNYENKGGKFYHKGDLKKIYGFKDEDYERLEPYIKIPAKKYPSKKRRKYQPMEEQVGKKLSRSKQRFVIELNSADSISLIRLKGIGSAFSKRIINYGTLLGGFVDKEQLLEVYGIDSILYGQIEPHVFVDTALVYRININSATVQEFSDHPYISYNVARAFHSYRLQHGRYSRVQDIKQSYLVGDVLYQKIAPYLIVE